MSDTSQILLLLGCSTLGFLLVVAGVAAERALRVYRDKSTRFINTNASSTLKWKIDHIIGKDVEIIIPVGRGLYPLVLGARRTRLWERQLGEWLERKAQISFVLANPGEETLTYWRNLIDRMPPGLRVYALEGRAASVEDRIDIESLERFHPTLVLKDDRPLAMWIENDHPPESVTAYGVQFVSTQDIVDFERMRFDRFLDVLRRLTDTAHAPPHLRELLKSSRRTPRSEALSTRTAQGT